VELAQDFEDVALGTEDAPDLHLAGVGQLVDDGVVERVGHRYGRHAVLLGHGHDQVFEGKGAGDMGGDNPQVQLERVDLEVGQTYLRGDGFGDHVFGQETAQCA